MQSCRYCRCLENVPLLWAFQTEYLILFSTMQCFRLACHCCLCLLVLKMKYFPQTSPPQNFRHSDQELHRHQLCPIDQQSQSTPNTTLSSSHVHFSVSHFDRHQEETKYEYKMKNATQEVSSLQPIY